MSASLLAIKHQTCRFSTEALRGRWREWSQLFSLLCLLLENCWEKKGFPSITFYFLSKKNTRFFPAPNLWNWMGKKLKRKDCFVRNQAGENSCNRRIFTLTALLVMKWLFEHQKKHWSTSLSAAPVTIITINKDVKWSRSFIRLRPLNVTAWSDSWWWTVFHLRDWPQISTDYNTILLKERRDSDVTQPASTHWVILSELFFFDWYK